MTFDGKIATVTGDTKWITNEASRRYVHLLRHRVSAVMVGIGTILTDDPLLTTRLDDREGVDSVRVVVDTCGRIPIDAKVLNLNSPAKTIIATTEKAREDKLKMLQDRGAEIIITPLKGDGVDLTYLMHVLGKRKIDSVLLEGGSTLNYSALNEGIVDKVVAFIAPKIVGGKGAKTPVGGEGRKFLHEAFLLDHFEVVRFGEDLMLEARLQKGG